MTDSGPRREPAPLDEVEDVDVDDDDDDDDDDHDYGTGEPVLLTPG